MQFNIYRIEEDEMDEMDETEWTKNLSTDISI